MTLITEWAAPGMFAFVRRQIDADPDWTLEALSAAWKSAFQEECSVGKIDRLLRPGPLKRESEVRKLIQVIQKESMWEEFRTSDSYFSQKSGMFDYASNQFGHIEEMDLIDLKRRGLTIEYVASQLVSIDADLFSSFAKTNSPDWVGSEDVWSRILQSHPDTWRVWVTGNGEVLAYWMFVVPSAENFSKACLGEYPEHEITEATLESLDPGGTYKMYGPGIYVKKKLTSGNYKQMKSVLASLMMMSFIHNMNRMKHIGVTFSDVCAPVFSASGRVWAQEKFKLSRMPDLINKRYAENMGWAPRSDHKGILPAVFIGSMNDELAKSLGFGG